MQSAEPNLLKRQTTFGAVSAPNGLSVLSYNLLAPCFVRIPGQPWNAYAHCHDDDLDWPGRQKRIAEILLDVDADLVCLQEVQLEERAGVWGTPEWLTSGALGTRYAPVLQPFKPKRAQKMADRNEAVVGRRAVTALVTLVRAGWPVRSVSGGSRSLTLVVELPILGALSLTNCHLEGNPERVETQQSQLRSALKRAEAPGMALRVIAGDFNGDVSEGSGLGEVLRDAAGEQKIAWRRVPSGLTVSSPGAASSVDHVLFGPALKPVLVTDWMSPALTRSGLPAPGWPSDHLPLGVCFRPADS